MSPSGIVQVPYSSNQTFTITPNSDYHIAEVAVDGVSKGATSEYTFTNVTESHILSVTFEINHYIITATAEGTGDITPSGDVRVNHGKDQLFVIKANPGYSVSDVIVDGVSIDPVSTYTFVNVSSNHSIQAKFSPSTIEAEPGIKLSAQEHNFDDVLIGDHGDWILTISNDGGAVLTVNSAISDNSAFTIVSPSFPQNIASGSSLNVEVRFSPAEEKSCAGTLTVTSNDPDEPEVSIALQGKGKAAENQSPVADFNYSPQSPGANREITFDGSSSHDPDGQIISYEWDFGDGEPVASGITMQHSYNKAAVYTVSLTVTDNEGSVNVKTTSVPVSLYPSEAISTPPSGPPTLDFANAGEATRVEMYELIQQVFNVERIKSQHEGKDEDDLFNCMDSLLRQLDPKQQDKDIQMTDMVRDGALTEGEELYVSAAGEIAAVLTSFVILNGMPAAILGTLFSEGMKTVGFEIAEKLTLSDLHYVVISYPKLGRLEIVYRPSQNKILVNAYLECSVDQNLFIIIPLTDDHMDISWTDYISSLMWCGITRPPEVMVRKPQPEIEDVQIIGLHSPAELRVYDADLRVTGLVGGKINNQIPNAYYYDGMVVVFEPSGTYRYRVVGTDSGTYGLTVASVKDGKVTVFSAADIPTSANAVHRYAVDWDVLSRGGEGVTVQVDGDGDGIPEQTIVTNSKFTQDKYLSAMGVTPNGKNPTTWADLRRTALFQNYPNPFNPETWIPYTLAEQTRVSISIHNVAGRLIRTLDLGEKPAGVYFSREEAGYWDGCDDAGEPVASGVYFYTFSAGSYGATKKMTIAK